MVNVAPTVEVKVYSSQMALSISRPVKSPDKLTPRAVPIKVREETSASAKETQQDGMSETDKRQVIAFTCAPTCCALVQ